MMQPPLSFLSSPLPAHTLSLAVSDYLFHPSAVSGNLHANLKMRSVISHDLSCITQCISTWVRFNIATAYRLGWWWWA